MAATSDAKGRQVVTTPGLVNEKRLGTYVRWGNDGDAINYELIDSKGIKISCCVML